MKLYDKIFCDDIRPEINNKLSLMGIYNDKIILYTQNKNEIKNPLFMKLALLLRFKLEESDPFPEIFEFTYFMNKKNITNISGKVNPTNEKIIMLALVNPQLPLEAGDLNFSIKLLKKDLPLFEKKEQHGIKIIIE
jgi:hypothetical protein